MIVIYKITSPSNKVYIGQTRHLNTRKSIYKNHRCADQPKIFKSLIKYGFENHKFDIVHELPKDADQEIINTYEELYMDLYKSCGIELLNIKEGGSYGKHSAETIKKMKGRPASEKLKQINRLRIGSFEKNFGEKKAKEMKKKISESRKGKSFEEILGFKKAEHACNQMSIQRCKRGGIYFRSILQFTLKGDFIKEFSSIKSAAEAMGVTSGSIWYCLQGRTKKSAGFKWVYKPN